MLRGGVNTFAWIRNETPSPLPGDFDGNGAVDQNDLDLVLTNWGRTASTSFFDGWIGVRPKGIVDQQELDAVLRNWGGVSTQAAKAIPSAEGALMSVLIAPKVPRKQIAATDPPDTDLTSVTRTEAFARLGESTNQRASLRTSDDRPPW